MKRIATATVIRGNGACEAYINGVVKEEMRRQQAKFQAERERAAAVEASRNRLLARQKTELMRKTYYRPNLFRRLLRPFENAWAMFWATLICWGEELDFWEKIEN